MTTVLTVVWSFLVKNVKFLKNAESELTKKLFVLVKLKATRIRLKLLNWTLCNILGSCSVVYVWLWVVWCKPLFQRRTTLNLDFSISAQKNFLIKFYLGLFLSSTFLFREIPLANAFQVRSFVFLWVDFSKWFTETICL